MIIMQERILAWMIYLNTVTDGGGTKWVQQEFTSNAVEGSMIVWYPQDGLIHIKVLYRILKTSIL